MTTTTGARMTPQRRAVLDALCASTDHPTASEVFGDALFEGDRLAFTEGAEHEQAVTAAGQFAADLRFERVDVDASRAAVRCQHRRNDAVQTRRRTAHLVVALE